MKKKYVAGLLFSLFIMVVCGNIKASEDLENKELKKLLHGKSIIGLKGTADKNQKPKKAKFFVSAKKHNELIERLAAAKRVNNGNNLIDQIKTTNKLRRELIKEKDKSCSLASQLKACQD